MGGNAPVTCQLFDFLEWCQKFHWQVTLRLWPRKIGYFCWRENVDKFSKFRKHQKIKIFENCWQKCWHTWVDGEDIYLLTNIDLTDILRLVYKSCLGLLRQEFRELQVRHLCRMNLYFLMSHQICHQKQNPKKEC